MKVALLQGFPNFHYEMLGYTLEYFLRHRKDALVTIFIYDNIISQDWMKFYEKQFGDLSVSPYMEFDHAKFDCSVLLTDDDPNCRFKPDLMHKVIIVNHYYLQRRDGKHFVSTRKFNDVIPWSLPVYEHVSMKAKKHILKTITPWHSITCVGNGGLTASDVYISILNRHPNLHINVINRTCNINLTHDRLHVYVNANVEKMYNLCCQSTHMLCLDTGIGRAQHIMSGAIPLAYSTCCKLIIPTNWNYTYLKTPQRFENTSEITIPLLDEFLINDLKSVYEEQQSLIAHRNDVFDKIISYIRRFEKRIL